MDPFWAHLGLLLLAFWELKSGQVVTKMCLELSLFENVDSDANLRFPRGWAIFHPETGPKIASRSVQDRTKSDDKLLVLTFDSFRVRFGVL